MFFRNSSVICFRLKNNTMAIYTKNVNHMAFVVSSFLTKRAHLLIETVLFVYSAYTT